MEQRTCNIIMCCKGNDEYGYQANPIYSIKRYMGKECAYPWERYSEAMIEDILFTALKDYINGADRPSCVLQDIYDGKKWHTSFSDMICAAFGLFQVKEMNNAGEWVYVNGFTKEQIERSRIELECPEENV